MEDKGLTILHNQYHCCWWPGDAMSHGIDLVISQNIPVSPTEGLMSLWQMEQTTIIIIVVKLFNLAWHWQVESEDWGFESPIRSLKLQHFHKNIRSYVENECLHTVNISNVILTTKISQIFRFQHQIVNQCPYVQWTKPRLPWWRWSNYLISRDTDNHSCHLEFPRNHQVVHSNPDKLAQFSGQAVVLAFGVPTSITMLSDTGNNHVIFHFWQSSGRGRAPWLTSMSLLALLGRK